MRHINGIIFKSRKLLPTKESLMKHFLLLVITLFSIQLLSAQTQTERVEAETAKLRQLYQLDESQATEMRRIQQRRFNNIEEIASLQQSDFSLWVQKRRAIQTNTEGSVRRMLRPEQLTVFDQQMRQRRIEDSNFIKEMQQQGRTKEQIELLLLGRE
jgi:tRNA A37 N6-isopentenylltransferase MiaA